MQPDIKEPPKLEVFEKKLPDGLTVQVECLSSVDGGKVMVAAYDANQPADAAGRRETVGLGYSYSSPLPASLEQENHDLNFALNTALKIPDKIPGSGTTTLNNPRLLETSGRYEYTIPAQEDGRNVRQTLSQLMKDEGYTLVPPERAPKFTTRAVIETDRQKAAAKAAEL